MFRVRSGRGGWSERGLRRARASKRWLACLRREIPNYKSQQRVERGRAVLGDGLAWAGSSVLLSSYVAQGEQREGDGEVEEAWGSVAPSPVALKRDRLNKS